MIQFKQNSTAAIMILTLTELVSIPEPNFLFVFTHILTRKVVAFVKAEADDESDYPGRYNQFTIDATVVFQSAPIGEWHYKVYEQTSNTNVDPASAGKILEEGKMMMDRSADFEYTMYESSTNFYAYNG